MSWLNLSRLAKSKSNDWEKPVDGLSAWLVSNVSFHRWMIPIDCNWLVFFRDVEGSGSTTCVQEEEMDWTQYAISAWTQPFLLGFLDGDAVFVRPSYTAGLET